MYNELFEGAKVTLIKMLERREARVFEQQALLNKYPNVTLVSVTLNLPGEVKNNWIWQAIFSNFVATKLMNVFSESVVDRKEVSLVTGPEDLILLDLGALEVKKKLIAIENESELGRLFDLDVLCYDGKDLKQVSRTDVGEPQRRCFLCEEPAKVCGRSRKHTLEDIHQEITKWVMKGNVYGK